ncbi:hypothetical protein FOB84_24440 (plasmid) [Gordonia bronchialis]|uniref:hypothetical protein n=1 Tax=Gordonia bronchialis TaxID=2054 RepID=UPI00019B9CF2|nr:hypothetical protein [Gordonia bronchialis]MCC3326018.1 hypothetical protein [Gordonia bronchialis]QGS27334.1 hypothetical protein FOB84_24440 [Gordonia bronchialis]
MTYGRGNPRFAQLPALGIALGRDPAYFAQVIGAVPNESEEVARLVQVRSQVDQLEQRLRRLDIEFSDRRNSRVGSVIAEATRTEVLAASVWPAVEGPPGYGMHVADRIDFVRTDGVDLEVEDLRAFTKVAAALDNAHAVVSSTSPRWSALLDCERHSVVSYSIPRLTAFFPPGVNTPYLHQGSVAVVALTQASWVMDVAGFIARILNYGLQTTRALVTETYGYAVKTEDSIANHRALRRRMHEGLLRNAQIRYVWGHFGLPEESNEGYLFPRPNEWPGTLTCVWLRETDNLIDAKFAGTPHVEPLKRARDQIDERVAASGQRRIIRVDIDYPTTDGETPQTDKAVRDTRTTYALIAATTAVNEMHARGFITTQDLRTSIAALNGPDRSTIAQTMHRWIEEKNALPIR